VSCECCVLSNRGLCDRLIPHPEEYYRLWYVRVWSGKPQTEKAWAYEGC
jgi:hypothetical protein